MKHQIEVRLLSGQGKLACLSAEVGSRNVVLLTTGGMKKRGVVKNIQELLGARLTAVYSDILPNPDFDGVFRCYKALRNLERAHVILALGGGSVLDTGKAVAALFDLKMTPHEFKKLLAGEIDFSDQFAPLPIIAVPTTAGTASEVTMWGTIWDSVDKKKYSITHPRLYPELAVLDPELTVSLPEDLTVATALDALSHAMESIWNKNANADSERHALQAISVIPEALQKAVENLADIEVREKLQNASLSAGLAFRQTRTAIAHSISYPLTARFGLPHGIAVSFTLPEIMRLHASDYPEKLGRIAQAMNCSGVESAAILLETLFQKLAMGRRLKKYIADEKQLVELQDRLIHPGRADNCLLPIDESGAKRILLTSFQRTTQAS